MKNKGFTLIELLLAIALAGVIALGISYMMVTTTKSYTGTKKELTLQSDAQMIMNTISDYLLQGNNAFYDSTNNKLTIYHSDGIDNTFDKKEIIWFNPTTKNIYICSAQTDAQQTTFQNLITTPTDDLLDYLLGQNVEEFVPNLGVGSNGLAEIHLKLSIDDSSYTISNTIKMRNEIAQIDILDLP